MDSMDASSPLPKKLKAILSMEQAKADNLSSPGPQPELRRATSFCGARTNNNDQEDYVSEASNFLIGQTTNLTSKHRRLLQAQQAWIKYQVSETSTTDDMFKAQRNKVTAQKLRARGGPHDSEFFKCFDLYLE